MFTADIARKPGRCCIDRNTRGLTELVILSIGRELGILDGEMFTIFVLMALVTTAVTGPLIDYPAADENPRSLASSFSPRRPTGGGREIRGRLSR